MSNTSNVSLSLINTENSLALAGARLLARHFTGSVFACRRRRRRANNLRARSLHDSRRGNLLTEGELSPFRGLARALSPELQSGAHLEALVRPQAKRSLARLSAPATDGTKFEFKRPDEPFLSNFLTACVQTVCLPDRLAGSQFIVCRKERSRSGATH